MPPNPDPDPNPDPNQVKLMQFDPNHRMTAMDGLRHPFCAQFHDAESE